MALHRSEITQEDLTVTRGDVQAFLDSGRAKKKDGSPDRSKPHGKTKQNVVTHLASLGLGDEALLDKAVGDLDSYV